MGEERRNQIRTTLRVIRIVYWVFIAVMVLFGWMELWGYAISALGCVVALIVFYGLLRREMTNQKLGPPPDAPMPRDMRTKPPEDDGDGGAGVLAKLPGGPKGPLVGAAEKALPVEGEEME